MGFIMTFLCMSMTSFSHVHSNSARLPPPTLSPSLTPSTLPTLQILSLFLACPSYTFGTSFNLNLFKKQLGRSEERKDTRGQEGRQSPHLRGTRRRVRTPLRPT